MGDVEHRAPFRFLRRREAPDEELVALVRGLAEPAYVYFRHDEEPDAPTHALRLLELLSSQT